MQQLEWQKIRAVGTINITPKGLGDTFKVLKKELMKDKNPNKPEKGGYDKGEYRPRSLESNPYIVVTVQKDSKVMT